MEELSDNYLMGLVQQGDFAKMGVLYERYHQRVFAYFYRCTADQVRCEDLVQVVFMRLLKYRHSFKGEGQFVYWLFTVVRNTWYDQNRKKDLLKHAEELDVLTNNPEEVRDEDAEEFKNKRLTLLKLALERLSPEKREAIILSRYEGLKYSEIAEIAGCSLSAVKTRVQRGLTDLRQIIKKLESRSNGEKM